MVEEKKPQRSAVLLYGLSFLVFSRLLCFFIIPLFRALSNIIFLKQGQPLSLIGQRFLNTGFKAAARRIV